MLPSSGQKSKSFFYTEDEGNSFLKNADTYLPQTTQHHIPETIILIAASYK